MLFDVLLFIVGLILLIRGGDLFVDGACGIAKRFHMPDIIVGATVVSIGTTLPEVMVSSAGALNGQGSIAYGNAIGSVICNTALIAAISIAAKPGTVNVKNLKVPVAFFFSAALIYCFSAYFLGEFPRWIGAILLLMFVAYILFNVRHGMKNPESVNPKTEPVRHRPLPAEILFLVLGAVLIAFGADMLVDHGTVIAQYLGVPETVIALTFVALGTSLPELITTVTSLRKGHACLGIGNVIGANVLNLVFVSGISVILAPFKLPVEKVIFGIPASLAVDIPVMLAVMLLLTIPALRTGQMKRRQGIVLLMIYAAFCLYQFAI